jgi:hypothetical protein
MRQPDFHPFLDRICKMALCVLLCLPGSIAAQDLCVSATNRPFIFSEPAQSMAPDEQRCYVSELPSGGVWLVDVSTGAGADVLPSLWIATAPCDADEEATGPFLNELHRTDGSTLLRVLVPGRYLFCVSAVDPGQALGRHWVTSLFAPRAAGDPDEDEPDPHPFRFLTWP